MAGAFDATLKQLLDACAPDWVGMLAPLVGLPATVTADPLDADLSTVQPVADKVFRLRPPVAGLLHIEPQSSWDGSFSTRLLKYNVLLEDRYGGPVYTVAFLLRREADSPDLSGTLARAFADGREYLRFNYTTVRVWQLHADQLLAAGLGVAPLALLTDDAAPRLKEVVDRIAERTGSEAGNPDAASLLLSCGYILSGLRYDKEVTGRLFAGVQKMRESSTYQAILQEGRVEGLARGRVEAQQDNLLDLLREKFGVVPPEIEARVRATTDPERLRTALLQVLKINSPAELPL
jgi:hypothetical protein